MICYDIIYLTTVGLPPGGSSTVHIYTQNYTQNNTINNFGLKAFWDSSPSIETKINDELTTKYISWLSVNLYVVLTL